VVWKSLKEWKNPAAIKFGQTPKIPKAHKTMLKFSANLSLLFTERPLPERFAAARAAGFEAVEIQFPYELPVTELRSLLEENKLRLVLINAPAGDLMQGGDGLACHPDRITDFQAAVQAAAHYANELNVPQVNILAGRQPPGVPQETCFSVLSHNLAHAVHTLGTAGATTVLEAINIFDRPGYLVHSVKSMQLFCADIHGLKMLFDCYHMSRMGEDILATLQQNMPLIGHIQFADNPGRQEPGTGRIDYAPIFSLLAESDYDGWCGAEYLPSLRTEDTLTWLHHAIGKYGR
jgi:hydroxypyruvate isomerase